MAEHDLAKVDTRVRFPSLARCFGTGSSLSPRGEGGKSGLHHLTFWETEVARTRKLSLRSRAAASSNLKQFRARSGVIKGRVEGTDG